MSDYIAELQIKDKNDFISDECNFEWLGDSENDRLEPIETKTLQDPIKTFRDISLMCIPSKTAQPILDEKEAISNDIIILELMNDIFNLEHISPYCNLDNTSSNNYLIEIKYDEKKGDIFSDFYASTELQNFYKNASLFEEEDFMDL